MKIFKFQFSNLKLRKGFSLVEVIVAVSLFTIVAAIAAGGFVNALRAQRQAAALVAANNNVSLALEQMVRELRTGFSFCVGDAALLCGLPGMIAFTNDRLEVVTYRLANGAIEKGVGGVFQRITGSNVLVRYLVFVPSGGQSGDGWVPRVTISLGVGAREPGLENSVIRLQTTASSRVPDT